jgi:hypothetical protein
LWTPRKCTALVDQFLGQTDERVAQIGVAGEVADAGLGRRLGDLGRFAGIEPDRLFGVEVLAGGDGGERDLSVQVRGHADVDDVDVAVGHQLAPVAGRAAEAVARGCLRGQRVAGIADQFERRQRRGVCEHGRHRAVAVEVATKPTPMRPMRTCF